MQTDREDAMNESFELIMSPLCQSATENGETIAIDIYGNGEGGWLLEVVDQYNNSTVWDEHFASDQAALDEALRTIKEDGIASLVGIPGSIPGA
jgi:hypothetical protein